MTFDLVAYLWYFNELGKVVRFYVYFSLVSECLCIEKTTSLEVYL